MKLTTSKTESLIVPGGCTKYIHAPDLVWNKTFKAKIQEFDDDWWANGVHEFTTASNIIRVPRRKIVQWVLLAWESLSKEMILNSMKSYALGLAVDGFEDDKISCFHEGKKTSWEKKVRKSNEVVIYLRTKWRSLYAHRRSYHVWLK